MFTEIFIPTIASLLLISKRKKMVTIIWTKKSTKIWFLSLFNNLKLLMLHKWLLSNIFWPTLNWTCSTSNVKSKQDAYKPGFSINLEKTSWIDWVLDNGFV